MESGGLSWSFIFMILVSGGGSNDLLDWTTAEDYWKTKGVAVTAEAMLAELKPADAAVDAAAAPDWIKKLGDDKAAVREEATAKLRRIGAAAIPALREAGKSADAEVRARAEMLLKDITAGGKAGDVRRLMAIRTLGELKAKEASAVLKGLAAAKEPFVAEYAQKALAAIEGKALPRSRPAAADLQKDLWLLPKDCGIVAQVSVAFGRGVSIDKVLEGMGEAVPAEEKAKARQKFTKMVLGVAEQVGNARLDAITAGVGDSVGDRSGYVVFVARGLYDVEAMRQTLRDAAKSRYRDDAERKIEKTEGADVIILASGVAAMLPSSEQLIFFGGPDADMLPIAEMAKALKAGKGGLADNAEMAKLIKAADTAKPFWAAARITEAYAKLELVAAFHTITLSGDLKDDAINLTLQAKGADANRVQECVANFEKLLEEGKAGLKREAERMPPLKALVEFLGSVQFKVDGVNVTGTATMKNPATFLTLPFMMFSARAVEVQRRDTVRANAAEIEAAVRAAQNGAPLVPVAVPAP